MNGSEEHWKLANLNSFEKTENKSLGLNKNAYNDIWGTEILNLNENNWICF